MKIAILTLEGPRFRGGVEQFNSLLSAQLGKKHEVTTFAYSDLSLTKAQAILSKASEKTPYSGYVKAKIMAKHFAARKEECDLVVANDFFGLYVNVPQILVFHGHYGDVFDCMKDKISFPYWLWGQELARVQNSSLRHAQMIITPSRRNAKYLAAKGLPAPRVISHGIDTDLYSPVSPKKAIEKYCLPEDFLLYVGSKAPWKNFEIVARASRDFDTVVVAKSSQEDSIKYLSAIGESEMPGIYSAAGLLLHPSRHEGFGYCVAEAMSCGTPPIFSRTGFGPELEEEIPEVIVSNPSDYSEVKEKINEVLSARKELGARCRKFILKHNNLKDWGKKWLDAVGEFE